MAPRRGHGVLASRVGAGDADAGCDSSSDERRDFLVRGGRRSADDATESAALARAVRAVGLQRLGRPAAVSVETPRADGGARAGLAVIPRAVRGLQWATLPRHRSPRARGHAVVQLCEAGPSAGWPAAEAEAARPASPAPPAPSMLRRVAPSGWQSAPVAGARARRTGDAHHGRR